MIDLPVALHIPDGFLSAEVAGACAIVAIAAVAIGLRVADGALDEARVPLLGVLAAFVFAAQMLNFPVAGGTSGHFLGATLAAVLLGPWVACLVMAVVIAAQALVFADGGVTRAGGERAEHGRAGGAARGVRAGGRRAGAGRVAEPCCWARSAVVSWVAVMLGAAATSVELAVSGTVPLGTALPAMLGVHALIGVGEAVITVAAVSAVLAEPARPDRRGALRSTRGCPARAQPAPSGALP